MLTRRPLRLVAALLLVVGGHAVADGSGGDAPDTWADAVPAPAPEWDGTLEDWRDKDWYVLEVPAAQVVRVDALHGPHDYRLELRDGAGSVLASAQKNRYGAHVAVQATPADGVARIGILADWYSGNYTLRVSFEDAPDVAVTALRVDRVPVHVDGAPQAGTVPPRVRDVHVTVTNPSIAPAHGARITAVAEVQGDPSGNARDLGAHVITLQPGESRVVTFTWDTIGQLGEVVVRARAAVAHDHDAGNDVMERTDHVHARGLGFGVDVLNARANVAGNAFRLDHGSDWSGIGSAGRASFRAGWGGNGPEACAIGTC